MGIPALINQFIAGDSRWLSVQRTLQFHGMVVSWSWYGMVFAYFESVIINHPIMTRVYRSSVCFFQRDRMPCHKDWFLESAGSVSSLYSKGLHSHQVSIYTAPSGRDGLGDSQHGYAAHIAKRGSSPLLANTIYY